ncbi:MAG: Gfo/Idh/MocA family protein [Thermoplasmataceae archaeon]
MKFGIVSLGNHALNRVVPSILSSGNTIEGVYSTNQKKATEFSKKYDCNQHGVLEELLKDEIDAVYISSPNFLHYDYSMAAFRHGKHVLLEKPMTLTVEHAEELVKTSSEMDLKLGIGFHMRFHPAADMIKKKLDDGSIGDISYAEASWGSTGGSRAEPERSWWSDDSKAGGGSIMGTGVHLLDFMNYIFGRVPDEVMGMKSPSEEIIDVTRVVLLRFGNALATVNSSRKYYHADNSLRIFGTHGTIEARGIFSTIVSGELLINGKTVTEFHGGEDMYEMEIKAFVDLVNGRSTRIARGIDGLAVVKETAESTQ